MSDVSILILTGQSGSGKSTAIRALEDHGFYCVDNMPTSLVEQLIELAAEEQVSDNIALVMDVRERSFLARAPQLLARLRQSHGTVRLVYLEASEEAIIRRYSETRRVHPLDRGSGLRQAILEERTLLAALRELADETIDTSHMSPHALRDAVERTLASANHADKLRVALLSFGFKYGLPPEADIVFDVRFLPNPYFTEELRPLSGVDDAVQQFVLTKPTAQGFLKHAEKLLLFLIPEYQKEGKRYLTVAIGCTGGRHRSVAIASELTQRLQVAGMRVDLRHRDVKEDRK